MSGTFCALIRVMDKRSQWKFDISSEGWKWSVVHADGSKDASTGAWPTLKECVADAGAQGYTMWKPEEERRRDKILPVTEILNAPKA
jgi:hypothetical protein